MMVVIAYAIFEASRRSGGLNAPDESFGDQNAEGVVHRLERDSADLGSDRLGHAVGCHVRLTRDGTQHSQSLGSHLNAALPQELGRVSHRNTISQLLELFKHWHDASHSDDAKTVRIDDTGSRHD
jgi:hypothetical protein